MRRLLAQSATLAEAGGFQPAGRQGMAGGFWPQNEQSPLGIYAREANVVKGRKDAEGGRG